jgi:hypothetical protein
MAVVERKSGTVTRADAKPVQFNDAGNVGGNPRSFADGVTAVTGDSNTSTYVFARIPSNSRFSSLSTIFFASAVVIAEYDLGLVHVDADQTSSADCLIDGGAVAAGSTGGDFPVFDRASTNTERGNPAWKLVNPSAERDPGGFYDITLTVKDDTGLIGGDIWVDAYLVP